jgi:hypothetical protein
MSCFRLGGRHPVWAIGGLTIGLLTLVALWVGASLFLSSAPPGRTSPPSEPPLDLQLEKFAAALGEVAEIQAKMKEKTLHSTNQAEVQRVEQEGSAHMVEAIQRHGLSVEEYVQISSAVQAAPELFERLAKIQQELSTEGGQSN